MAIAATLEQPNNLDKSALRALLLARICAKDGATRTDLLKDIYPLVAHLMAQSSWRITLELDVAILKSDKLITEKSARLRGTVAGAAYAQAFIGGGAKLPTDWVMIKNGRLIAKALGLELAAKQRLSTLLKPDGLRAEIVLQTYDLKLKDPITPAKIRSALAIIALERAFGNQITSGLGSGSGLSVKASRLLAGQLTAQRRDLGTDRRLIAQLAGEQLGVSPADSAAMQLILLRRLLEGPNDAAAGALMPQQQADVAPKRKISARATLENRSQNRNKQLENKINDKANTPGSSGKKTTRPINSHGHVLGNAAANQSKAVKPDLVGFSAAVLHQAQQLAKGWSGDRKAFISHVSESIRTCYPQWALSDIEFKCMLTEAHQAGSILLAYADLKDKSNIKDVQESAISYKDTVWHYIRVEA